MFTLECLLTLWPCWMFGGGWGIESAFKLEWEEDGREWQESQTWKKLSKCFGCLRAWMGVISLQKSETKFHRIDLWLRSCLFQICLVHWRIWFISFVTCFGFATKFYWKNVKRNSVVLIEHLSTLHFILQASFTHSHTHSYQHIFLCLSAAYLAFTLWWTHSASCILWHPENINSDSIYKEKMAYQKLKEERNSSCLNCFMSGDA